MKSLSINVTQKCNAACKHCCFICEPHAKNSLSDEQIKMLVNYAITHDEVNVVSLTGGEALLNPNMISIIKTLTGAGKKVSLITNGFWAVSMKKTEEMMKALKKAGLVILTISYDQYHSEYIPIQNIKNILQVGNRLDFELSINMVDDKSTDKNKMILNELNDYLFYTSVTKVPVMPVGRAKSINKDYIYKAPFHQFSLRCPSSAWEFVVHHDGYVYPCCSPAIFETCLSVGSINESSIEELDQRLYSNILLYVLKKEGLGWFIDHLELDLQNKEFVSNCEICKYIFSDNQNIEKIRDDLYDYYTEEFERS